MRSYVAIHMSLIFGVGALVTGSIWAKASWGHWWVWNEPTLVSFLIVMLLYATYQPLRFAIADRERQSRYASVFAITAAAFVPMNFIAVRLAPAYVHPRVLQSASNLPASMGLTFLVSLLAVTLLYVTLWRYEIHAKQARARLRALRARMLAWESRRGAAPATGGDLTMPLLATPALPLHTAGKYVAAAYIVFFALILIYVAIMATRLNRIERELGELLERSAAPPPHPSDSAASRPRHDRRGRPRVRGPPEESARV